MPHPTSCWCCMFCGLQCRPRPRCAGKRASRTSTQFGGRMLCTACGGLRCMHAHGVFPSGSSCGTPAQKLPGSCARRARWQSVVRRARRCVTVAKARSARCQVHTGLGSPDPSDQQLSGRSRAQCAATLLPSSYQASRAACVWRRAGGRQLSSAACSSHQKAFMHVCHCSPVRILCYYA